MIFDDNTGSCGSSYIRLNGFLKISSSRMCQHWNKFLYWNSCQNKTTECLCDTFLVINSDDIFKSDRFKYRCMCKWQLNSKTECDFVTCIYSKLLNYN